MIGIQNTRYEVSVIMLAMNGSVYRSSEPTVNVNLVWKVHCHKNCHSDFADTHIRHYCLGFPTELEGSLIGLLQHGEFLPALEVRSAHGCSAFLLV